MQEFINGPYYPFSKDIAAALFSIIALFIAGLGLSTWKAQTRGVKAYEIAYNLHYAILKLREAIRHVRNPAIWPSESNLATQYAKTKYPDKDSEEVNKDSHQYVYEMRWEEIKNASIEVESHLLGAEVLWGSDILELMKPLNKKISELNIAIMQKFNPDLRTKTYMDIFTIVYNMGDGSESDTFSVEVSSAIQQIIKYIRKKL